MNITRTLTDTKMNAEDKGHIEAIAQRHEIGFLDHTAAMMVAARLDQTQVLAHTASFSVSNDNHTSKGLYLDSEDPASEEDAYFIALHELGHTVLKHQNNDQDDIQNEIEAWEWAFSHAQRFPGDQTICNMLDCLSTYTDNHEALARPESLLALACNPVLWKKEGWKLNQFKLPALTGVDPVHLIGHGGVVREVPQPFARMLAEHIQYSQDTEKNNFLLNMRKVLGDPAIAERLKKVCRDFGTDEGKIKEQLHREMAKRNLA